jgi:hypothetical protein
MQTSYIHVPNFMCIFLSLGSLPKESVKSDIHCDTSYQVKFLQGGVLFPMLNPQDGSPTFVGYPRLFIQYIRSYPPYLVAVDSIGNLGTRHAVVTNDTLNMVRT